MRFLNVSNMYPTKENPGYGVFVKNFVAAMALRGARVDVVAISGRGNSRLSKLCKYFSFFIRSSYCFIFRRYDFCYIHFVTYSSLPFLVLRFFRKTKFVCNFHGEDLLPSSKTEKLLFFFTKGFIASCDLIVVPSEYYATIVRSKFPDVEVYVYPSGGVDLDVFKPISIENFITKKSFNFGFVGRIERTKGWEVLLDSFKILSSVKRDLSFSLKFVGEGREVRDLINKISALGLQDTVEYVGPLSQKDLTKFYNGLDALVFPTMRKQESLGLVGLEAMACGVPVLGSSIGGVTSYLTHGFNGLLFLPDNRESLYESLCEFIEMERGAKEEMKVNALITAKKYCKNSVATALYRELELLSGVAKS